MKWIIGAMPKPIRVLTKANPNDSNTLLLLNMYI